MKKFNLSNFRRALTALALVTFVVIALPSCQALASAGEGVSGGVYYLSEEYGAKAGLEFRDGTGRAFARKDIIDPATGKPLSRIEFEKRFTTATPVIAEK